MHACIIVVRAAQCEEINLRRGRSKRARVYLLRANLLSLIAFTMVLRLVMLGRSVSKKLMAFALELPPPLVPKMAEYSERSSLRCLASDEAVAAAASPDELATALVAE